MSWINYSDSEVRVFHPVCEEALKLALAKNPATASYVVQHHRKIGSLEMDFAVLTPDDDKVFCVIEVKRTPRDVTSTRFQYQAMSYVQGSIIGNANPYYILTNLETAIFFRYSSKRPAPYQQILEPGISAIASFGEDKDGFVQKLACYFADRFDDIINNRTRFDKTLKSFGDYLLASLKALPAKHSFLSLNLHKYIYTVFATKNLNGLNDTSSYLTRKGFDILRLNGSFSQIDFKPIFERGKSEYLPYLPLRDATVALKEMEEIAKRDEYATLVSDVIYDIEKSGRNTPGEIATNPELARFVALLAKIVHQREISPGEQVCDPAAGSGNLIFESLRQLGIQSGSQVVVNEIRQEYSVPLSLRLGLYFANSLSPANAPVVSISPLEDLSPDFFRNVSLVVLNPPFISGVASKERKKHICQKLGTPTLNIGQMPYEGLFLELLVSLLPADTTVSVVFPSNHLAAIGPEAVAIRKFLLEKFGLTLIATYPMEGLFSDAKIATCVLVGKPGGHPAAVQRIECKVPLADIDMSAIFDKLNGFVNDGCYLDDSDFSGKQMSYAELTSIINDGWFSVAPIMEKANAFIDKCKNIYSDFIKIADSDIVAGGRLKRGPLGNTGGSKLLFLMQNSDLYNDLQQIKGLAFKSALYSSKIENDSLLLNKGDRFFPLCRNNMQSDLLEVVGKHLTFLNSHAANQPNKQKTKEQFVDILFSEKTHTVAGSVLLLPRASRRVARYFVTTSVHYFSTNVLIVRFDNKDDAFLTASWMSTLFYQIICFVHSNNHAGLRKMEEINYKQTLLPDFSLLSPEQRAQLLKAVKQAHHVSLADPEPQELDYLWGEILFGEEQCANLVAEAKELLWFLSNSAQL